MDLAGGLSALKTGVELTRALRDAAKAGTVKPEEFAGRVAEIYDYIADSKDALVDAKDQIYDLKDEIRKLKAAAEEQQSFQFLHGVYWKTYTVIVQDEEHEAIHGTQKTVLRWDGPFCPLCKDDKGKAVRLKNVGGMLKGPNRVWQCELHDKEYEAPTMKD